MVPLQQNDRGTTRARQNGVDQGGELAVGTLDLIEIAPVGLLVAQDSRAGGPVEIPVRAVSVIQERLVRQRQMGQDEDRGLSAGELLQTLELPVHEAGGLGGNEETTTFTPEHRAGSGQD